MSGEVLVVRLLGSEEEVALRRNNKLVTIDGSA